MLKILNHLASTFQNSAEMVAKKVGTHMKVPDNNFHVGTNFFVDEIFWGTNFLGPKIFRGPFQH